MRDVEIPPRLAALFATYPDCQHAIAFCELLFSPREDDERDLWAEVREGGPDFACTFVRESCMEELALGTQGKWEQVMAETETCSFKAYLKAKLGML